MLTLKNR